mgnify:CR=1 FL=1
MTDQIDRAGAFQLGGVNLISYSSFDGDGTPKRLDIRNLLVEFNIYEDINSPFLSGDLTLIDGTNAIQELPITGFERLEFFFRSPNTDKGFDFSVKSGHPMFVYALENRTGANPRSQVYTLKFISLEAIRDNQTRVSQAFTGSIDQMVLDVCYNYLKTKKDVLVEETKGVHKFVMPRVRPTKVIRYLRRNCRSLSYENSGMLFYENAQGFQFKSYEGLFCKKDGSPRPAKANYSPKVKNVGEDDTYNLQSVEDFRVISQFNTLQNTAHGVYASRLITHDLYNKTFATHDFDYNLEYTKQNHLEKDANGDKIDNNGILPFFNYDQGETFGSKNEGVLPKSKDILQKRVSQHLAINSLAIEITVPGNTEINIGDIVHFDLPKYSEATEEDVNDKDIYLSGRYLISAARHQVSIVSKRHTLVLELIKDSFNKPYPEETIDLFTNNEDDTGSAYSATEMDEYLT